MIEIKLLVMAICAGLFAWGGYSNHNMRRFVMPTLLAGVAIFLTHSFWPCAMLSSIGVFCLGYGEKSILKHIFSDGWGRSVWGLLASTCLSLPLFLTHHLGIVLGSLHVDGLIGPAMLGMLYLTLNFILENALKNIPQLIGDAVIGLGLASIVLLIHP